MEIKKEEYKKKSKAYNQEYYKKYKKDILKALNAPKKCNICGSEISNVNMARHQRTKTCQKFIKTYNLQYHINNNVNKKDETI